MRRTRFAAIGAGGFLLVLAGCNAATPTSTPVSTPTSTPTNASTSSLMANTWYLTSGTSVTPAFQWNLPQEQVGAYTITFNTATDITVRADCNQVLGQYTTTASGGITLTPNVVTLSYCGPNTHDKLYLAMLRTATTYTVTTSDLKLTLADGGSLSYTATAPPSASPGTSASPSTTPTATASASTSPSASPTASPTAKPTASPTEQPSSGGSPTPVPSSGATATPKPTEVPTATPAASPSPSTPANGLLGHDWQLTAITVVEPPFQGAVPEEQQPNYTVTFNTDATFAAKADCNNLIGGYTTPDATAASGTLTLTPGPTTPIACPPGSLSGLYMDALGQSASYAIADNLLTITLVDGGTLQYK